MKHSLPINWIAIDKPEPKHDAGWTELLSVMDEYWGATLPYTPGRHAKPFGKHHPATPITYDRAGNTTPLATVTSNLDVAA